MVDSYSVHKLHFGTKRISTPSLIGPVNRLPRITRFGELKDTFSFLAERIVQCATPRSKSDKTADEVGVREFSKEKTQHFMIGICAPSGT